jgi:undecaprenyl-diphosphatase
VRDITALGSFALLGLIVAGVCFYLLMLRLRAEALLVLISVLGGTLISTVLKMTYDRPRPDLQAMSHQFTSSFPSGHAMLSAVTFLTLGALLSKLAPTRALRIYSFSAAIFLTLLVGTSRVFMGVHYPSDVLAGWCVGAAWALLCSAAAVMLQRFGKVMPDPVET